MVLKWDTESKHSIYETNCVTVSLICIEDTENESSGISVGCVTGRYDIETGKSDTEIPTPRG